MTTDIERRIERLEQQFPLSGGGRPSGLPDTPAAEWTTADLGVLSAAVEETKRSGIARPLEWMATADLLVLAKPFSAMEDAHGRRAAAPPN